MLKFSWLILALNVLLWGCGDASVLILPTFSWDPRNKIFGGTLCGGNENYAHISVQEDSEIYFLCPSSVIFSSIQRQFTSRLNMYENMFLVTKGEFDRCQVDGITQHTKKVMVCDSPKDSSEIKYRRFYFSSLTTSAGIPFFPNTTYYFIATSDGNMNSLDNRAGGHCSSHNMRLAVTVCGAEQNCIQNEHLCKTPKEVIGTTTTTTPLTTTPLTTKTMVGGGIPVVEPKPAPQKGNAEPESSNGFGTIAAACLIGGLFVGLILGFFAVILAQRFTKRNEKEKSLKTYDVDKCTEPLQRSPDYQPKNLHEDNPGYRFSTVNEGKRLLSTSSNSSSERYSVIPPVVRTTPPPGTIAV